MDRKRNSIFAILLSAAFHALLIALLVLAFPISHYSISPLGRLSTVNLTEEIKKIVFQKSAPAIRGDIATVAEEVQPESPSEAKPSVETQNAQATATSNESRESVESRYVSELTSLLNRNKKYPRESLLREQEGLVVISVSLDHDGVVHDSKVDTASPFRLLNEAALATIARIGRFPAPPAAILDDVGPHGAGSLRLKVPISFRMERR